MIIMEIVMLTCAIFITAKTNIDMARPMYTVFLAALQGRKDKIQWYDK